MNIGQAAERASLPPKTLRYYEEVGLVVPDRRPNGYRSYTPEDVQRLRFVQRARSLGFGIENCRQLLALYANDKRTCSSVLRLAAEQLSEIDDRIEQLRDLRQTLATAVDACHGDDSYDCSIIDMLAEEAEDGDAELIQAAE